MSKQAKNAHQLAQQLFKLSLADGAVSDERVSGVLAYVAKHRPASPVIVETTTASGPPASGARIWSSSDSSFFRWAPGRRGNS